MPGRGTGKKGILVDMEAAAIYQAGNYYYAPHQMLFLKVVTDHGTTQEPQSAGVENIFTDHGTGQQKRFNIYPAAFDNAGKKQDRQESMQEAFRSQVEEQAKLCRRHCMVLKP